MLWSSETKHYWKKLKPKQKSDQGNLAGRVLTTEWHQGTFYSDRNTLYLDCVKVVWLYTFVKCHRTLHLNSVDFNLCNMLQQGRVIVYMSFKEEQASWGKTIAIAFANALKSNIFFLEEF